MTATDTFPDSSPTRPLNFSSFLCTDSRVYRCLENVIFTLMSKGDGVRRNKCEACRGQSPRVADCNPFPRCFSLKLLLL